MGGHGGGCGTAEILVFCLALVAGTGCSLTSKFLLDMRSTGMDGEDKKFEKPLFQTLGMFVGMVAALAMHALVIWFRIPFPGYTHPKGKKAGGAADKGEDSEDKTPAALPIWMYFLLVIPSLFDLVATALCMLGLMHVQVSIYQMLRGSAIIFVALLKQFVLGDRLHKHQWVGVFWNVVSIVLVGLVAMLATPSGPLNADGTRQDGKDPVWGVSLILAGAFVQSLQYAFEEKVMSMEVSAPPLLLIGMEGFWGTIVCTFILYPICYALPGADVGGTLENPYDTLAMMKNSPDLQRMFFIYFLCIFFYNMLACLVTFMLNSVWHAILDNFRPITVWSADVWIYYYIATQYGEEWTVWSYLQLLGMFVLLYGTAVYNANIKLTGDAKSCFCLDSYAEEEKPHVESEVSSLIKKEKPLPGQPGYQSPYQSPFQTPRSKARREAEASIAGRGQFTKVSSGTRGGSFSGHNV